MRKFILDLAGELDRVTKKRPNDRRGQDLKCGGGQHPGLLLQRYLCENVTGEDGNPEEKRAVLQAAINAAANPEVRELYKLAFKRWQRSLPELTAACELQTPEKSRLIVGLGSENVLETGIRLHHTYGMPILPGSALKGLAAHYGDQVWGTSEPKFKKPTDVENKAYHDWLEGRGPKPEDNYHRLLFGTTDDSGCIIFHDAWFVPESNTAPLKLDVMTPHHPDWLNGSVAPTDFDSPRPVPFLSVSGAFLIAVSWSGPTSPHAHDWTQRALDLLTEALFHWGIGGKTSSGYGRFDEEKWKADTEARRQEEAKRKEAAERQAAVAAMSPIERTIQEFLQNHPNKTETRDWIKLYEELRDPNGRFTSPEDRLEVAKRVKAGMQADERKPWKGKGKDGDRKKLIQQILGES